MLGEIRDVEYGLAEYVHICSNIPQEVDLEFELEQQDE